MGLSYLGTSNRRHMDRRRLLYEAANYTPNASTTAEADDQAGAHLKGIDDELGALGGAIPTDFFTEVTADTGAITASGPQSFGILGGKYLTADVVGTDVVIDSVFAGPAASSQFKMTSGSYALTLSDAATIADATAGAMVLTLPLISGLTQDGIMFWIHIEGADSTKTVTIQASGTDTIQGAASVVFTGDEDVLVKADSTTTPDRWLIYQQTRRYYVGLVHVTDSDYTVTATDEVVIVTNTTANPYTISLPAIDAGQHERSLTIILNKNSGGGSVGVDPPGTDTLAGAGSYSFTRERDALQLVADNTTSPKTWHPAFYSGHPHLLSDIDGGQMTVDLNMGSANIVIGGLVDGVDVSAHAADAMAHTTSGTSFPSSPVEGQRFTRTDQTFPNAYRYDATRGHWFSEAVFSFETGRSGNVPASNYLRHTGAALGSAAVGHQAAVATGTIIGYSYSMAAGVAGNFEIHQSGTSIAAFSHLNIRNGDMTLDVDISGGVLTVFNAAAAGTVTDPVVTVWYVRRGT